MLILQAFKLLRCLIKKAQMHGLRANFHEVRFENKMQQCIGADWRFYFSSVGVIFSARLSEVWYSHRMSKGIHAGVLTFYTTIFSCVDIWMKILNRSCFSRVVGNVSCCVDSIKHSKNKMAARKLSFQRLKWIKNHEEYL